MKKTTVILGFISVLLVLAGSIFKLNLWPGAGVILTLGVFLLSLYFLFFTFESRNMATGGIGKNFFLLMGITGIVMALGFIFKIQHWPGANFLIGVFLILYLLLVIAGLLRALGEKSEELRNSYTHVFIWMLGVGLLLLYPIIQAFFT